MASLGPCPATAGTCFQVGSLQDTSCNVPHCRDHRSLACGTRIHGRCLPALSPVFGRRVVKFGRCPGCASIVELESERRARRTMLANQDDVFPATDRLHCA